MRMIDFCLKTFSFILIVALSACNNTKAPFNILPNNVVPTENQIDYQKLEMIGFIHFTTNTFTDKEWGYGNEDPSVFNPTNLDTEQWVIAAKAGGLKQLILTAKHHDGFCLWPSEFTEYNIKNSPYKSGNGDIVREFVDACHKHQIKVGLYISPWDRNHAYYGKKEYITYYRNQIKELLTNYGEINEIWFDGANGGDGYYGGANEIRKIDQKNYYGWDSTFALVKSLQPNIKIFSDAGPDVHWIGNEQGFAGTSFWSTIHSDSLIIGDSKQAYLNQGDPNGNCWIIGQCDVSIRPGWFYHHEEDSLVKTANELFEIYKNSVGRNAVLLINIPPDRRGLLHDNDIEVLKQFKQILDMSFKSNLASIAEVTCSNYRSNHKKFSPINALNSSLDNYWACDDSVNQAKLMVDFETPAEFNCVVLQEPIQLGQRVSKFVVEVYKENTWQQIAEGTTIGYKRILEFPTVKSKKLRVNILKANNTILLSSLQVYNIQLN